MMQQYLEIKAAESRTVSCFSVWVTSMRCSTRTPSWHRRELDLTLTTRDRSKDKEDQYPHVRRALPLRARAYIARLVAKGYKVAICEQTEDPATGQGTGGAGQ